MTPQEKLQSAAVRMMVGITKVYTPNCEWYEGIEHDGADEAFNALAELGEPLTNAAILEETSARD